MEVGMGELAYSDSMSVATVPIKVSGVDYILTDKDFKISKTSAVQNVEVKSTRNSTTPTTSVTYVATVTAVSPGYTSSGTFTIAVLDKSKKTVESKVWSIDGTKFYVPPSFSGAQTEYSKTDSDVAIFFGTTNLKKKLSLKDILIEENATGATLSEISVESEYERTKVLYKLTFTGVEKGGNISISAIGDDGTLVTTSSGNPKLTFPIDYKKVYVPPVVQAVAKGILAGEYYWCYEGDLRATSMYFLNNVATIRQYYDTLKVSYKIDSKNQIIFFDKPVGNVNMNYWMQNFIGKEFYYDTTNTGRVILYEMVYHGDLDYMGTGASKKFFLSMARDGADLEYDYDDWTVLPPVPYSLIGNVFYCDECTIDFLSADTVSFNDGEKWNRNLSYKVNKSNRQIEIMDGKRRLLLLEYYIDYGSTYYLFDQRSGAYWTTRNPWLD